MNDSVGSSPLARGLLGASERRNSLRGIIPARAGFTFTWYCTSFSLSDHPRSRGVYQDMVFVCWFTWGSSPLARGLHNGTLVIGEDEGIIPARAGFTREKQAATR